MTATHLKADYLQSESKNVIPLKYSEFFPQTAENFKQIFYMPTVC